MNLEEYRFTNEVLISTGEARNRELTELRATRVACSCTSALGRENRRNQR